LGEIAGWLQNQEIVIIIDNYGNEATMTPSQSRNPMRRRWRPGLRENPLCVRPVGRKIQDKVLKSFISRKEKEAQAAQFRKFWQSFQAGKSAFRGEKRRFLLLERADLPLGLGKVVHDYLA
jgi:hypothetical protein